MIDNLGDRMKAYECAETARKFMPLCPIYARIDGRGFSSFTRGMDRPFDADMSEAMVATTMVLVAKTHARIGYTQSDEISLVWLTEDWDGEAFFGGKVQKTVSILASLATAAFTAALMRGSHIGRVDALPHFDARAFTLPSKSEAANAFLWRELDATKNAVSMAARAYYSHKALHGKRSSEMQEMLFQKGVNFNDYPNAFKRGTFVRRVTRDRVLTDIERERIPEKHRSPKNQLVTRSSVERLSMPRFSRVANRDAVIFDGAEPALV